MFPWVVFILSLLICSSLGSFYSQSLFRSEKWKQCGTEKEERKKKRSESKPNRFVILILILFCPFLLLCFFEPVSRGHLIFSDFRLLLTFFYPVDTICVCVFFFHCNGRIQLIFSLCNCFLALSSLVAHFNFLSFFSISLLLQLTPLHLRTHFQLLDGFCFDIVSHCTMETWLNGEHRKCIYWCEMKRKKDWDNVEFGMVFPRLLLFSIRLHCIWLFLFFILLPIL